jgi:hypothetical protein
MERAGQSALTVSRLTGKIFRRIARWLPDSLKSRPQKMYGGLEDMWTSGNEETIIES